MDQLDSFLSLANIQNARKALKEDGHFIIGEAYSPDLCKSMIEFIDDYKPDEKTEINYLGTEMRIWDAQRKDRLMAKFYQECNIFISCLLQCDKEAYTLLAIRNKARDTSKALYTQGRWHVDSFGKMLKIFLFLNETTESSGPFEFIPNTHTKSFKLRMLLNGSYFQPSDFFSGKRAYQKLDDAWVNGLTAKGYRPFPVICKAGTILVIDATSIHRARPCREGSRYAITTYYH